MRQSDCVRAFRDINEENIAYWVEVYNQENVTMKFNIFHNTFLLILENSFPLVYKKKKDTNKWITKGIGTSYNHKRALYTLVKKSSDERLKLYKVLYDTNESNKRSKETVLSKTYDSDNEMQLTWKIVNKETGKKQAVDNITELQVGRSKVTNPKELVEVFNKYFATAAENLTMKNSDKNKAIKLLDTLSMTICLN
jgi:hypothetical protein